MLTNTYRENNFYFPAISNKTYWSCSSCSFDNKTTNYPTCDMCHQIDSRFLQYTLTCKLSQSIWKCSWCSSTNNEQNGFCESCYQSKPLSDNTSQILDAKSFASIIPRAVTSRSDQNQSDLNIEQKHEQIISYCKKNKTHFVDDQFIPSVRSLGSKTFETVSRWLRIHDISPSSDEDHLLSWTVISSPKPSDIEQGALGNCWFLAALALITEQPRILRQILLTQTVNAEGVYLVRLCHNGLWKTIIVDDCFPCTDQKKLVFSQAKGRQLYVPLIEKACAKLFGSYTNLISGTLLESLQLLTGAPCDHINFQTFQRPLDTDIMWAKLLSACGSNLLIGASTGRTDITPEEYANVHIQSNHAFSILAAHTLPNTTSRFVLVRDPHAQSIYAEEQVTPRILAQLKLVNGTPRSSGAFWISWSRFLRFFASITISNYNKDHYDIRHEGQFTRSSVQPVLAYRFHLSQTTLINISLVYHRSDRKVRDHHTQSFVLCDIDENSSSSSIGKREHILKSERGGFTYWTGSLRPGNYILIPYSISFRGQETKENDYTLVIHSNIPLDVSITPESATVLADCLISAIVKKYHEATKEKNLIYYVTPKGIQSMFLVIENCSTTHHLNVHTKMMYSNDIQYSRHSLVTNDCIPPHHRQLIFLAERTGEYHEEDGPTYSLDIEPIAQLTDNRKLITDSHSDDLHFPRIF